MEDINQIKVVRVSLVNIIEQKVFCKSFILFHRRLQNHFLHNKQTGPHHAKKCLRTSANSEGPH